MKRPYGSGQIYEKWGAYYGRWRTPDGQRANRRLGVKRTRGGSDGLTRAQAERVTRRLRAEDAARRPMEPVVEIYWRVGLAHVFIGIGVGFAGTPASHSLTALSRCDLPGWRRARPTCSAISAARSCNRYSGLC